MDEWTPPKDWKAPKIPADLRSLYSEEQWRLIAWTDKVCAEKAKAREKKRGKTKSEGSTISIHKS